jgi:kynurenine formamidase
VVEAAQRVRKGQVFRLDAKVGAIDPPFGGRAKVRHEIVRLNDWAHDDVLSDYNTQESTQWDGLGHVGHTKHGFYNGVKQSDISTPPGGKLGIHRWADRFVGKGLLIDVERLRQLEGRPVKPFEREVYTLEEMKRALERQKTQLSPGSILLVRTGWMGAYEALSPAEKQKVVANGMDACSGLEATREIAAWLWDNRIAAIGVDNPAVEALPFEQPEGSALHFRALALLGLPLGELFRLAPLAEDCAADERYEFMVVSAPLNLENGIASPPNAVAIK